ncbi:MAG: hydantoinase/oxoprolinase family protein [Pseudomonadota bacterium]
MPDASSLSLAVDIGGTFTDTVLTDRAGRILASTKTLTTRSDPASGALEGAHRALAEAGQRMGQVARMIHGTTLATNALIEKRGAVVASITTEGFRDILEIAYERRYDQYDLALEKPDLLVPRSRCFTVRERMSVDGAPLIPLELDRLPELLEALDASGAEAVAICLLHAYANPNHERQLRSALRTARPELAIALSCQVSPEAREFDRLCTTVANAYIQPLMARYLVQLSERFAAAGLACPILMMTAGGGMTTLETAARFPIRLVESGPAGGAILAARIAAECGLDRVLSFDMGGTTAKLCLIDEAEPQTSRRFEIARAARFVKGSGMPVRIPVVEMIEIGAGGGSIAGVDRLGRLTVGPESAGSEPGPAAFGRGGTAPTVTDADIALGYIRPELFAEGHVALDPAAADRAIDASVGAPLGLDTGAAADGISRIVDESMASAARMHAAESGKDLSERTIIAFGGNGPLHAGRVARSAGIAEVLVPKSPGVASAVGFLLAPVAFEMVRSRYMLLQSLDIPAINALFEAMRTEAVAVVRQGAPEGGLETRRAAFMRYSGQGHEIEIALPDRDLGPEDLEPLTERFETAYAAQYARPVPGMAIEVLNWAVRVATPRERPEAIPDSAPSGRSVPTATRRILCDLSGAEIDARFVERRDLAPGDTIPGPALIAEPQTTTLVGRDFTARIDARGNIRMSRDRMEG